MMYSTGSSNFANSVYDSEENYYFRNLEEKLERLKYQQEVLENQYETIDEGELFHDVVSLRTQHSKKLQQLEAQYFEQLEEAEKLSYLHYEHQREDIPHYNVPATMPLLTPVYSLWIPSTSTPRKTQTILPIQRCLYTKTTNLSMSPYHLPNGNLRYS